MGTPSSEELELAPCACSAAPCVLQQSGQQGMVSNLTRHARAGAVLRDMFCNDLRLPSYFIVGGLVFTPLCEPYLHSE